MTDSDGIIKFDPIHKPGISNLLSIMSCCTGRTIETLEQEFKGIGYGEFKQAFADSVVNLITPIQQKYEYFLNNKELLDKILDDGALKASSYARKTISKVKRKMGLIRK